jgi:hypothetical protein
LLADFLSEGELLLESCWLLDSDFLWDLDLDLLLLDLLLDLLFDLLLDLLLEVLLDLLLFLLRLILSKNTFFWSWICCCTSSSCPTWTDFSCLFSNSSSLVPSSYIARISCSILNYLLVPMLILIPPKLFP